MSRLKYGPISAFATQKAFSMPITTAETIRAKSGRFITKSSGYAEIADAGDTELFGWIEAGDSGASTSVANARGNVIAAANCSEKFRIPVITGTLVEAMIGKTCDLVRATKYGTTLIQGADLTASGEDVLLIVGGDLVDNKFVDVMFNPAKIVLSTGVA